MESSYYDIGKGTIAIDKTAEIMVDNIRRDAMDPVVIQAAHNIIRQYASGKMHDAHGMYSWCHENTRYTKDPYDVEYIMAPKVMIVNALSGFLPITGDCDDFTQLICCLCRAIGLPTGLRIMSVNGKRWHHVYGLVQINGRVLPMDLTEKSFGLGQEHRHFIHKDIWI